MEALRDDKDWTWVLEKPCDECGLDTGAVPLEELPGRLRAAAQGLAGALDGRDARVRPAPHVWSPLEYTAHVRDACDLATQRLALMLSTQDARFANWDQDATAVSSSYGDQDPEVVAAQVVTAAGTLATAYAAVAGNQWERTGTRSDGAVFTVASFGRYFLHDPVHHLWDVTGLRQDGA